jgi:predicted phosphoribosyltransferase
MKQILNKLDYEIHRWVNSAMIKTEVTYYFHNPRESFKNFPRATDEEIIMYIMQNNEDYYKVKGFFDLINNAYNNRG